MQPALKALIEEAACKDPHSDGIDAVNISLAPIDFVFIRLLSISEYER